MRRRAEPHVPGGGGGAAAHFRAPCFMTPAAKSWQDRRMRDPTKTRGFQNVSTTRQAVFVTENGDVKIRQFGPRRWQVLPRGAEAYEVGGKQEATEEARKIVAAGLTPSHIHELQDKQRRLQRQIAE